MITLEEIVEEAIWFMPVPMKKITVKNFYKKNKDKEDFEELWNKKKQSHLEYWNKYNLERKIATKLIWRKKDVFEIVRIDYMQNPCYIYTKEEKLNQIILSIALKLNCEKPNLDKINPEKGSICLYYYR